MPERLSKKLFHAALFIVVMTLMHGCAAKDQYRSSSAVEYLYPDEHVAEKPQIPALALPLKVGIAFVPEAYRYGPSGPLTENEKMKLLQEISEHFQHYEFVDRIEMIPSAYLRPKGGFTNLDQIRTMYGIDVMVLVSYDQHQFTDEGIASLSYWTIIGAYIVPGEKNDTHTMVDAVVYDIKSRKLLFRAPGVSHIKGLSTPINLSEQLRKDSIEGFRVASGELIKNLDIQLQLFKEKVKASPQEYRISHREGYTGGGSIDALLLIMMALAGGYGLWSQRRQNRW